MAYSHPFIKLTWGGTLAEGQDIWSSGLHLATPENDEGQILASFIAMALEGTITPLSNRVVTFFSQVNTGVPTGVKLTWVKLAMIGTDGKYSQPPIEIEKDTSGGSNVAGVPQNSLVVTLDSDKWKDPGKYNRFYMPFGLAGAGSVYSLNTLAQNNYLTNAKTFINGINSDLSFLDTNLTVSCVTTSEVTNGYLPVQKIKIGRLVDTQRRRRNSIPEVYVESYL